MDWIIRVIAFTVTWLLLGMMVGWGTNSRTIEGE
jgi:hypothetical protein